MAQVKFNQGLVSLSSSNPIDNIGFLYENAPTGGNPPDAGYIYLGPILSATKYLKATDPQGMYTPAYTYDTNGNIDSVTWSRAVIGNNTGNIPKVVVTADYMDPAGGTDNSPITTCRRLIDSNDASASGYTSSDNQILTAKAVTKMISSNGGYYYNGGWNYNSSGWNTWTARHSIDESHNIFFTLPVEVNDIELHGESPNTDYSNTLLPTSKAVATFVEEYVAGLAGGMRYMGSISSTTLPVLSEGHYKSGDVFIASQSFWISNGSPGPLEQHKVVDVGDMIVLNSTFASTDTSLTYTNCDVFERNIEGAVTAENQLPAYGVVYGTGGRTVGSTGATSMSDVGKMLSVIVDLDEYSNPLLKPAFTNHVQHKVRGYNSSTSGENQATIYLQEKTNNGNWTDTGDTIVIDWVDHATMAARVSLIQDGTYRLPLITGQPNNGDRKGLLYYNEAVTVDNSTGTITSRNVNLLGPTSGTVQVDVYEGLIWHVISS